MNIWIVNPYGTLPSEGWREYRSAMLARALAKRGHLVRWWISDIEHRSKQRRPIGVVDPLLPENVSVEVVPARAYRRNISLGRILYERSFAAAFITASRSLPAPDLIVLADPSLFFGGPVVTYARRLKVPFVLDILDLWPELFHILLPKPLRRLGRSVFAPLYHRRDRLVQEAAAVVAVTRDYLEDATRRVDPRIGEVAYLGVDLTAFLPPVGCRAAGEPLEVVYAGTLGDAYDMPVVVAAMERLAAETFPVRFTIAGDGPWKERVASLAERFPQHVRFLGRVPADALPEIYAKAHIGLASYAAGSTVSMPVKFFDYMAAGLATVGSMEGEAGVLLVQGCGRPYQAGCSDDLVAALRVYFEDDELLAASRHFAANKARDFDQVTQHERVADLIEGLLSRKGPKC